MAKETESHAFSALLEDENFCALLRLFHYGNVTWDQFLEQPLPQGMSPKDTWSILKKIGQTIGVKVPILNFNGDPIWYRLTHQLANLLNDALPLYSKGSSLYTLLISNADHYYMRTLRIAELVGAATLLNIPMDRMRIEQLTLSHQTPETDFEQLALNILALDEDLKSYLDTPFSYELLVEFCDRMSKNVCLEQFGNVPIELHHTQSACKHCTYCIEYTQEKPLLKIQNSLQKILDYANRPIKNEHDTILLKGNLLADGIRAIEPFGGISTFVGSLVSRLYYAKHALPVMSLLPISNMKAHWQNHGFSSSDICCTPESYETTMGKSPEDYTIHQTLSAQLIVQALKELEEYISSSTHKENKVHKIIRTNSLFNNRQRAILIRAARTQQAEFHIDYHQKKNGISYATARRDLIELEEQGYLCSEYRGRSLVFLSGHRLEKLLESNEITPGKRNGIEIAIR